MAPISVLVATAETRQIKAASRGWMETPESSPVVAAAAVE